MIGNTVIIILLVPLMFQVFWLVVQQTKRHQELQERLDRLETLLRQ